MLEFEVVHVDMVEIPENEEVIGEFDLGGNGYVEAVLF